MFIVSHCVGGLDVRNGKIKKIAVKINNGDLFTL